MERDNSAEIPSFSARLGMACRLVFNGEFARQVALGLKRISAGAAPERPAPAKRPEPAMPEVQHASGLLVLSALQREGRLIDFLQQDVAGFSDQDVGAAARVVHAGCSKVLKEYVSLQPALAGEEGASTAVAAGFDAQRIRLTGNVSGQPPFRGVLRHHGWVATELRFPQVSGAVDPKVLAPAEVELA